MFVCACVCLKHLQHNRFKDNGTNFSFISVLVSRVCHLFRARHQNVWLKELGNASRPTHKRTRRELDTLTKQSEKKHKFKSWPLNRYAERFFLSCPVFVVVVVQAKCCGHDCVSRRISLKCSRFCWQQNKLFFFAGFLLRLSS